MMILRFLSQLRGLLLPQTSLPPQVRGSLATRFVPVLATLLAGTASAQEVPVWWAGEISVSTGFDFTSGDYGENERTNTSFVPLSVAYLFDHFPLTAFPNDLFELRVTVPYVSIDGPAFETGTNAIRDGAADGLGDVTLAASYIAFPAPDLPFPAVEISARIKFPTASNSANELIGTGDYSYTLQAGFFRRWGRVTPLATISYRIAESKRGFRLRNALFTSVGGSVELTPSLSMGLLYDWSQQTSAASEPTHQLFPYFAVKLRDDLRLMPYAVAGLSTHAPKWGTGVQLRHTIPLR